LETDISADQARVAGLANRAVGFDPTAGKAHILPAARCAPRHNLTPFNTPAPRGCQEMFPSVRNRRLRRSSPRCGLGKQSRRIRSDGGQGPHPPGGPMRPPANL